MSEQTENTQVSASSEFEAGTAKPAQPPKKKRRRWWKILLSIVGLLLIVGAGSYLGYKGGLQDRINSQNAIVQQQVAEQFQYALVDIEFKRYDAAIQRLQYIISKSPSFPGVQEKLTEVLVISSIPTATPAPTLTSTPDFSGAESAYQRAQQLIQAQDWGNALSALDIIRKLDPTYKTAQVDGMYYFALRNYGNLLITQQGNLEGGIYYLTLAERFGLLDNTSVQLREGARNYIIGASFWELDWKQAYTYFTQVGTGWPALWDGTMTASERLHDSAMYYGDELFKDQDFCGAYEVYTVADGLGGLEGHSRNSMDESYQKCFPPTDVPATEVPVPTP